MAFLLEFFAVAELYDKHKATTFAISHPIRISTENTIKYYNMIIKLKLSVFGLGNLHKNLYFLLASILIK